MLVFHDSIGSIVQWIEDQKIGPNLVAVISKAPNQQSPFFTQSPHYKWPHNFMIILDGITLLKARYVPCGWKCKLRKLTPADFRKRQILGYAASCDTYLNSLIVNGYIATREYT
jgi:hypothetical protein